MLALTKGTFLGQTDAVNAAGIITSLSYYPSEAPYNELPHYHETAHCSMVLKGGNLEKRKAKQTDCLPGTVTVYQAGEVHHSVQVAPGSCQVNLEITEDFAKRYDLDTPDRWLQQCDRADMQLLMLRVYKEMLTNDEESALSLTSGLLAIGCYSAKKYSGHNLPVWVNTVRAALNDRWSEPVTLTELARVANLHPANLSGYFPQYFGCTIGEYRRKLKLQKAFEFMRSGNSSLTNIAYRAGFADQSHFMLVCKDLTGWNPKQIKALRLRSPH
jgi:AraC family transcriptional regulator